MTNFELILQKIQNWNLDGAAQDMQHASDLDDAQSKQLDKLYREYREVDDTIQALRRDLIGKPEAVLISLEQLPDIKATRLDYEKLLADARDQLKTNQRASILERIKKAEDLSLKGKFWAEAQEILRDIQTEYPSWAADTAIAEKIHQASAEAKKAEEANILEAEITQDIQAGKPTEGNERLSRLELLGRVPADKINALRNELTRLAAHKQARSSKDTRDFSDVEDEFAGDINRVEGSISSIQSTSNYSYRLLYNNRVRSLDLYTDAINKLGKKLDESKKNIERYAKELEFETLAERKTAMQQAILTLDATIDHISTKLADYKAKRNAANESLPDLQRKAYKQIAEFTNNYLAAAQRYFEAGNLDMALSSIAMAEKAGLPEKYDDPNLKDHLDTVVLAPEQQAQVNTLTALIKERQEQRRQAIEKKTKAQEQLAGQSLSLKQLKSILADLKDAQMLDKDTPGLSNAIQNLEARIELETQLQKEQYKLRIISLCQKGLVDEAQRSYTHALDIFGNDLEIKTMQDFIQKTQTKLMHLEKVAEDFLAGFRLARETLTIPDVKLQTLLDEWKKDGFETTRIAGADAQFRQYISELQGVKQQAERLEQGIFSGKALTELQTAADFLRNCFLRNEARIQELLARYWQALASQYTDKDQTREEQYLQDALGYAENSKDDNLVAKIKTRLDKLQDLTELGHKAREMEEFLVRYRGIDLTRALEKIGEIAPDDPLRHNYRIGRLIDDIEYEGRRKRAADFYQKANEQFKQGEYATALFGIQQALSISSNYFEAIELQGDIKAAQAEEEPFLNQIQASREIDAETDKKLTGSQVKQLEDTKFLVDQLEQKIRVSPFLLTQKRQFIAYYQSWRNQIDGKVKTGVQNADLLINAGDFDRASQILANLRENGIPYDMLVDISNAENKLKANQSQANIIDEMIKRASEIAGEGKYGIEKAITLLTMKDVPAFIRSRVDQQLQFFKDAQEKFGRIAEDIYQNKVIDVFNLLDEMKNPPTIIKFDILVKNAGEYDFRLQNDINTLKEVGIKESNQTHRTALHLHKILRWYIASINTVENDPQDHRYLDTVKLIKQQVQTGEEIKEDTPPDLPHSQAIHSSIDTHIALLNKLKQNNDVFANIHKIIINLGIIGLPNPGFWRALRIRLNNIVESPHVESDERNIKQLIDLINQKEKNISTTFIVFVSALLLIICCVVTGLGAYFAPTLNQKYFPTSTNTLTPTFTPTITLTPTFTPTPSITPRSTVTPIPPTPTPQPLLVQISFLNGIGAYLYPGVFGQIHHFSFSEQIYVQRYCILGNDYWGEVHWGDVQIPDNSGWILMSRYTTYEEDLINADIQAGLRKKPVSDVFNNHLELKVPCPSK